jgi:hypothetical protein
MVDTKINVSDISENVKWIDSGWSNELLRLYSRT